MHWKGMWGQGTGRHARGDTICALWARCCAGHLPPAARGGKREEKLGELTHWGGRQEGTKRH